MGNSQAHSVPGEDANTGISDLLRRNKKVSVPIAFGGGVVVAALAAELTGASRIAAIIVSWGAFMAIILVLFGLVPYWAIGFLGYRER